MNTFQVAIDGPAASGKSSTARAVASKLGIQYLDTGAMYRAFTLALIEAGIQPIDGEAVAAMVPNIEFSQEGDSFFLAKKDISKAIRSNQISTVMAPVCANPAVRSHLVELQRRMGRAHSCVLDGRDIGTVVFPDAKFKFFLVADLEERARRRQRELLGRDENLDLESLVEDIRQRDLSDASRSVGPLLKADDAVEVDTTHLSFEEQVDLILTHINKGLK